MDGPNWDQQFLPRLGMVLDALEFKLYFPFQNDRKLVGCVREIFSALSGRFDPHFATEAACGPVCGDLLLIKHLFSVDSFASALYRLQHQDLLRDVGCQAQKTHDLWQPGPGHEPQV
ncbi:MAG TPA: hypothetical protein VGM05_22320 [Planctomycetaceae bacterium]|jgi:hypothetical protein